MLLPCNFQEKAARFALLASVGGHGEKKLAVVPVQSRAEEFTKPENPQTSRKNEIPEVTSRIETSRLRTQRGTREKSSALSCL